MSKIFISLDPTSVDRVCKAAAHGDAASLVMLAHMYRTGNGVQQDVHYAFKLYGKAAQLGDLVAVANVGQAYQMGDLGVAKDHQKAVEYLRRASDGGNAFAAHHLGFAYEKGLGVPRDASNAIILYGQAARSGYAPAVNMLGWAYETGLGVSKDQVEAAKFYQMAAELGDTTGMVNLGSCLELGEGVEQDLSEAIEMYKNAAERGLRCARILFGWEAGEGTDMSNLFERAMESKDTKVMMKLARLYRRSPIRSFEARKLIEKIVESSTSQ